MLDKDKLILVFEVCCGKRTRPIEHFINVKNSIERMFDDSVKCIITASTEDAPNIKIRQLNTDKVSPEELQSILDKAESVVKELKDK